MPFNSAARGKQAYAISPIFADLKSFLVSLFRIRENR